MLSLKESERRCMPGGLDSIYTVHLIFHPT
jgi:hypothetical protein